MSRDSLKPNLVPMFGRPHSREKLWERGWLKRERVNYGLKDFPTYFSLVRDCCFTSLIEVGKFCDVV